MNNIKRLILEAVEKEALSRTKIWSYIRAKDSESGLTPGMLIIHLIELCQEGHIESQTSIRWPYEIMYKKC